MNENDLHDYRREQDFRTIGGDSTNFYSSASSVDRVSEEIYSQQAFYMPYAFARIGGLSLDGGLQQTFNLTVLLLEVVSVGLCFIALPQSSR